LVDVEEIKRVITSAKSAIDSRAEVIKLIFQAHKSVYEFTEAKIKDLDQRTSVIRQNISSYVDNYLISKDRSLKPHYDRAKTAMLEVSKIDSEVAKIQAEFNSSKDITRKKRLNKILNWKMCELEHIANLQDQAAKVTLDAQDKVNAIIPHVQKAWEPTKNLIYLPLKLSVFSMIVYTQEIFLKLFPVVTALCITIVIDSWTNTVDNIFIHVDAKGYHSLAILVLFSIQYVIFDKIKELISHRLQSKSISRISEAFSKNLSVIEVAEKELAYAEAALMSLVNIE